jgi:hypothetical protein
MAISAVKVKDVLCGVFFCLRAILAGSILALLAALDLWMAISVSLLYLSSLLNVSISPGLV